MMLRILLYPFAFVMALFIVAMVSLYELCEFEGDDE